jgi:hypothetical protein
VTARRGYLLELNLLRAVGDFSPQGGRPLTKHLTVEITPSEAPGDNRSARKKRRVREERL